MNKDQRIARDHAALLETRYAMAQVYVRDYGDHRKQLEDFGFKWNLRIDGRGPSPRSFRASRWFSVVADIEKCVVAWDLILELGLVPYVFLYKSPGEVALDKRLRNHRNHRRWVKKAQGQK